MGQVSCVGRQATQSPDLVSQIGLAGSAQSPGPAQPGSPPVPLLAEALVTAALPPPPLPLVEAPVGGAPPAPVCAEVPVLSDPLPQAGAAKASAVKRAARKGRRADEEGTSMSPA